MDFKFIKGDCLELMKDIPDSSVNCILTDPPYKYLKNQKLEVDFDEPAFFNEAKRILRRDGFIVLFGRGSSFYRWNTMLADLGFVFKEEIIWNKRMNTLPGLALQRTHETISIHTFTGKIQRSIIPWMEKKQFDMNALINDIKRIRSAINGKEFEDIENYLKSGIVEYTPKTYKTFFKNGFTERSRGVATLKSIKNGMCESSIIEVLRSHYIAIHPTQKPVRLVERLLALTTKEGDMVVDPFAGSCSTGIACKNSNRSFIGFELDDEYYNEAMKRIKGEADLFFNPGSIEPCAEGIEGMPDHGLHFA